MGVPDSLPCISGNQIHPLRSWFVQNEIVASNCECMIASTLSGHSQDNFIVTWILKCDLEVENVLTTQIEIVESTRQDRDAGVSQTLTHIVVAFRQMNVELAVNRSRSRGDHLPALLFAERHRFMARRVGRSTDGGGHRDILH